MRKPLLALLLLLVFAACSNNENEERRKNPYEIDSTLEPSGERMPAAEREARLESLISDSRRTMDSIDGAYKFIRNNSRTGDLTLDEREQVNESLIELSDAKDLITLQVQEAVISSLKEKTATLQTIMTDMNTKSQRMLAIANTLSRVSGVIEKTTNLLSSALSVGLIRPRIEAQP